MEFVFNDTSLMKFPTERLEGIKEEFWNRTADQYVPGGSSEVISALENL